MPPGAPGPAGQRLPGHAPNTKSEVRAPLVAQSNCVTFRPFGVPSMVTTRASMSGSDSEAPPMNTTHFLRAMIAILSLAVAAPASAQCTGDLTGNGIVDGADLGYLLNAWGPCPN